MEIHTTRSTAVFVARTSGSNCPRFIIGKAAGKVAFKDDFHRHGVRVQGRLAERVFF